MVKNFLKLATSLFFCIVGFFLLTSIYASTTHAARSANGVFASPLPATQTVTISQAGVTTPPIGHVSTMVSISGTGFTAGAAVALYTTPDANQCGPGAKGLQPFSTPNIPAQADGTFQLSGKWPTNSGIPTTSYFICALAPNGEKAISPQPFTVAQNVMVAASTTTVNPGDKITFTGENWLPVQQLTVAITPNGQAGVVASDHVTPDANGHFSLTLTVDANTPAGSYGISVIADNEATQAMSVKKTGFITVAAMATPTPTPTAVPSPTVTITPTVGTGTPSSGGTTTGGNAGLMPLIFILGGTGVLMVIVGIIIFAAYSRTH